LATPETLAACSGLILRYQVSANDVPAAIEIRMIPDDPTTFATPGSA